MQDKPTFINDLINRLSAEEEIGNLLTPGFKGKENDEERTRETGHPGGNTDGHA